MPTRKNHLRAWGFVIQSTSDMTERGAEEHLHAIRQLMERATIYRAISAPTALVGGLLSVVTSAAMLLWLSRDDWRNVDAMQFFLAWTGVFLATLAANTLFILRGAQTSRRSRCSPPA